MLPAPVQTHVPRWLQALADPQLLALATAGEIETGEACVTHGWVQQDAPLLFGAGGRSVGLAATVADMDRGEGTERRRAGVLVDEHNRVMGYCDCERGLALHFCHHQVALALVVRGLLDDDVPTDELQAREEEDKGAYDDEDDDGFGTSLRTPTPGDEFDAVGHFVQQQSAPALANWIMQWARRDSQALADLRHWAMQARAGDSAKAFNALKVRIADLIETREFVHWRDVASYAGRTEQVLPLLERALETNPVQARQLCEYALTCFYKVVEHIDDSNGEVSDVMTEVQNLLLNCLRAAPPDAGWLSTWLALMQADPFGDWDEAQVLAAAGPAVQAAFSQKATQDWNAWLQANPATTGNGSDYTRNYHRGLLRNRYIKGLQLQGDPATVIQTMHSTALDPADFSELVQYCEKQQMYAQALHYAQEAWQMFPDDYRCEADLLRCCERSGLYKMALDIRNRQLQRSPDSTHFFAVLNAAKAAGEDAGTWREALYQWARERELRPQGHYDVSTRVEWLLAEELPIQALALVEPPHVCHQHLYAKLAIQLPAPHWPDAVRLLQQCVHAEMRNASSPYDRPLDLVRQAVKRMPQQERSQWVASLRAQYRAKRNFVAGLDALRA